MKFMVINRPNGADAGTVSKRPEHMIEHAAKIRSMLEKKQIECCYHMVSGGHVYVVNANTTDELQLAVRLNPLFEESHTEVIPITHAADFLESMAEYVRSRAQS